MENSKPAKNVLVILGEGFEDAEAAVLISALRWTDYRSHLMPIRVAVTGMRQTVRGRFGSHYEIDVPINEVDPNAFDAAVVPGGFKSRGFEELYDKRVLSVLQSMHGQGKLVVTLCVGLFVAGEAGLLEGKRATTYELSANKDNLACLAGYGAQATHEEVCVDGNLVSCTGPRASEQVAALLLEALIGPDAANEVNRFRRGLRS